MRSHLGVLEDPAVLDDARLADGTVVAAVEVDAGLGDILEALLQFGIICVFCPKVSVGCNHAIEGQNATGADFVHHLEPYAHVFGFTFLDGAVAKFGVVCGGDLLNVEEDASVTNDIVGHIMHVMDSHIIADIA